MTDITREAILASIKKWDDILNNGGEDRGVTDCPLCAIFCAGFSCDGCPVAKKTNLTGCNGTPYDQWSDLIGEMEYYSKPLNLLNAEEISSDARQVVESEVTFLKEVLADYDRGFDS